MGKKFSVVTLAVLAFAFASAARSNAGTEIVRDYSANAPTYNYAPAPPPPPPPAVYYAPPPVRVVVYQTYRYCPPVRVVAYHRFYPRRVVYCR